MSRYGAEKFEDNIATIVGRKPCIWWRLCWKFFTPIIILVIFVSSLVQWKGVKYNDYQYPAFAEFIGWMIALASMIWIPGIAAYKIYKSEGSLMERVKSLTKPDHKTIQLIELKNAELQD